MPRRESLCNVSYDRLHGDVGSLHPSVRSSDSQKTITLVGPWLLALITSTDYFTKCCLPIHDIRTSNPYTFASATNLKQATDYVQHPDHLFPSTFLKGLVKLWASFISPSQMTFFQGAGSKACGSYSAVYAEQESPICAQISPTMRTILFEWCLTYLVQVVLAMREKRRCATIFHLVCGQCSASPPRLHQETVLRCQCTWQQFMHALQCYLACSAWIRNIVITCHSPQLHKVAH